MMCMPAHDAVRDVVHAAYAHYIARIGKPPGPMLDDYAQRIADRQAWVMEDAGRIVGILVLEETRRVSCSTTSRCCPDARARATAAR